MLYFLIYFFDLCFLLSFESRERLSSVFFSCFFSFRSSCFEIVPLDFFSFKHSYSSSDNFPLFIPRWDICIVTGGNSVRVSPLNNTGNTERIDQTGLTAAVIHSITFPNTNGKGSVKTVAFDFVFKATFSFFEDVLDDGLGVITTSGSS